jgi:precorrin-6A/cobalt-precorrin-6A reductase
VEENLAVLRRYKIGVMVTKDSGAAGGVPAKIEAARLHGCRVVVVQRPKGPDGQTFSDVSELVAEVVGAIGHEKPPKG